NLNPTKFLTELCVAANFVEVFLAREGHDGPVGINYLEKIQFPHLSSIYGAMLAGASVIIMGAGIPREIPSVIDQLCSHSKAVYSVHVADSMGKRSVQMNFDPEELGFKNLLPLTRPKFIPIISSEILAVILSKKTEGKIDGFIIEGPTAGGHNAPPRGILKLDSEGQPEYGKRDVVNLDVMRKLGIPFWLAGSYGSNAKLKEALQLGAEGIQVGTAFALCKESGLKKEYKDELLRLAFEGCTKVKTDPLASPTGFPFKVASVAGTLS
ncbi:TPA: 2-nitropropane dioxygenase, partial [bacterium]|nr:2-nitropropane dioxygenase [bacterium]